MKKILFILSIAFLAFSCQDFNEDNFDGYKDFETPKNVGVYQFTMETSDYTAIVNALNAKKNAADSVLAKKLNSAKKFSEELRAADLIPYALVNRYKGADVKSSAKVTFEYDGGRDETVSGLTGTGHILDDSDYKVVWGTPFAKALTPAKAPASELPEILTAKYPSAEKGQYQVLEYYYSKDEPVSSIVEGNVIKLQDFEGLGLNANDPIAISGWLNVDLKGSRTWQAKSFSDNFYAQATSNGSGAQNDVWLISEEINLSSATSPYLVFDVKVGYYNTSCLSVLVSSNFDGNAANIATATWSDITSQFEIPTTPSSGYGEFQSSKLGSLTSYVGKKVRIAFRYQGDDTSTPKKTTTYQIDNIKVTEAKVGIDVAEKETRYAAYVKGDSKWEIPSNTIVLQSEDYTGMGFSSPTLTTAQAPNYLPIFLNSKYPYAQEGDSKIIVYRTKSNEYYADKLIKSNGTWTINKFVESKTDQFVVAHVDGKTTWIFDPTIIIPMSKPDFQLVVDYVKEYKSSGNEDLIDKRGNAEFYYGFSAYYPNITYRIIEDRIKDNTFPKDASLDEQIKFMDDRTKEGLIVLLTLKYPDAQPTINGVDQLARFDNIQIYKDPSSNAPERAYWSYTFQCVGNKDWKFVRRSSADGRTEEAK